MKKGGVISAFYRIFGQSFETLKQRMFRENEKDIGKTTVDSWGFLWLMQMKFFLLIFFFLSIRVWAQTLPPGTYHNLSFPQPMVLDTGTYIFIHLEMKNLGEGIWLDARNATKLTLIDCSFEGTGKGTALLTSGNLVVNHCHFRKMEQGIRAEAESGKTVTVQITQNTFTDLGTSISLTKSLLRFKESSLLGRNKNTTLPEGNKWIDNGTSIQLAKKTSGANVVYDFTLKCNQFKLSCADGPNATATSCDGEPLRKGLIIGEGVRVTCSDPLGSYPNEIGGLGAWNSGNQHPNANEWPVTFGTDRAVFPSVSTGNIQEGWYSPSNWTSLENNENNPEILYRRYKNEFVQEEVYNIPPFRATPTNSFVKTIEPINPQPVTYENTCSGLIDDPNPIFPARIAVVPDNQSITSIGSEILRIGPWLGEAVPNPAQGKTKVSCFIPASEEMAILQFIEFGTGKVVSAKAIAERGKMEIEIDLSHFATGVYGCQIILKGEKLGAKRFMVVK